MWDWLSTGYRSGASAFEKGFSKAVQAFTAWGWTTSTPSVSRSVIAPPDAPTVEPTWGEYLGQYTPFSEGYTYQPPIIPNVGPNRPPYIFFEAGRIDYAGNEYLELTDLSSDIDSTWEAHQWEVKDSTGTTIYTRSTPGSFVWVPPAKGIYTITRRATDTGKVFEYKTSVEW